MKIGVLSDIHGNLPALKVCLSYMREAGCEEYLFLGDFVSDTPYPRETMDLLYEWRDRYPCRFLRGNREEYLLEQRRIRRGETEGVLWPANSASGNLLYTYERLTERDFAFFEELPICFCYEREGLPAITCCHGSPVNSRELLQLYEDRVKDWLDRVDTEYLIAAHTHLPGQLRYHGKMYMNTGTCGIAITDPGMAQGMILTSDVLEGKAVWKPEWFRLPYDVHSVVSDIFTRGLHAMAPWFIDSNILILLTGKDLSAKLVALATRLQTEETGSGTWPMIEERFFEAAAEKLGIPAYDYETAMNYFEKDKLI